ncbi:hypothetical protein [Actinomadura monticuli]|uniref:Alpha/beta hydrolase n=1 Tax=Actinomadura monticuli TaxID=3097367 RepID=A0ABV4Q4Y9_9ACTN
MTPETVRLLRAGPKSPGLLAVDSGLGMAEASFPDLSEMIDADCAIWETVPSRYEPDDWLAELDDEPLVVLGYCSSASLACAVAARLSEHRRVVLFDPVKVDAAELWFMAGRFLAPFAEDLPRDELDRIRALVRGAVRALESDLAALADALKELYIPAVLSACAAARLPDEVAAEFTARFAEQLRFMLTAAEAPLTISPPHPTVVLSRDGAVPGFPADRTIRLTVPRAELLSSPAAAAIVTSVVSSCVRTRKARR